MQLQNLKSKFLGRAFCYYKEIDSTQSEIWRLIENKAIVNGQLVMADIQTSGRGTHGRIWHTDEENNIAFSFYVEMNSKIESLDGITYEIAEIIADIFKENYNVNVQIKKPNDIVFNSKKIGGILTEAKTCRENVKYLVIGIGINTNKEVFPNDIKDIATSIKKEFGITIQSKEFVGEFCNRFENKIIQRSEKN